MSAARLIQMMADLKNAYDCIKVFSDTDQGVTYTWLFHRAQSREEKLCCNRVRSRLAAGAQAPLPRAFSRTALRLNDHRRKE